MPRKIMFSKNVIFQEPHRNVVQGDGTVPLECEVLEDLEVNKEANNRKPNRIGSRVTNGIQGILDDVEFS